MKGGCYCATVAINKFQVQAVECSVIFLIIVDSISPLYSKKVYATEWLPPSECERLNANNWMQLSKCNKVNATKWMQPSECIKVNATK